MIAQGGVIRVRVRQKRRGLTENVAEGLQRSKVAYGVVSRTAKLVGSSRLDQFIGFGTREERKTVWKVSVAQLGSASSALIFEALCLLETCIAGTPQVPQRKD